MNSQAKIRKKIEQLVKSGSRRWIYFKCAENVGGWCRRRANSFDYSPNKYFTYSFNKPHDFQIMYNFERN